MESKPGEQQRDYELLITFRSSKILIPLLPQTTVDYVKSKIVTSSSSFVDFIDKENVRLLFKGQVLKDDTADLYELLYPSKKKTIRLIALGVSNQEAEELKEGLRNAPRIRDDLTDRGRLEEARKKRTGKSILSQAASRYQRTTRETKCGFGRIETLPNLPNESKAREILTELANDPGVIACMTKHNWNVPCLAELYPEGKVGETDVCVMGLNQNKGQKILLRIRTDDLAGFRKTLSIKKVLYHELAHNVHSDHNNEFFQLMRQIEKECNEMNWRKTDEYSLGSGTYRAGQAPIDSDWPFRGGTGKLGGMRNREAPLRDLTARAALLRMSAEEEEIQRHCGCGRMDSERVTNDTESVMKRNDEKKNNENEDVAST